LRRVAETAISFPLDSCRRVRRGAGWNWRNGAGLVGNIPRGFEDADLLPHSHARGRHGRPTRFDSGYWLAVRLVRARCCPPLAPSFRRYGECAHVGSLVPNRKANGSAMQALIDCIRLGWRINYAHLPRRQGDGEVPSRLPGCQKRFDFRTPNAWKSWRSKPAALTGTLSAQCWMWRLGGRCLQPPSRSKCLVHSAKSRSTKCGA
jgi:hypothetical protein